MRLLLFTLIALFLSLNAWSTHNRAGEITYEHVAGTTYRVKITTFTKTSAPADREWMPIDWGDESGPDSIQRTIDTPVFLPNDVQRNEYIKTHNYPGPGQYTIISEDPNRNEGILNLGGDISVNLVFTITTDLNISPVGGVNNSVQLLNPPLDEGCVFQPFQHNPAAFDPDGDSLHFELVPCLGPDAQVLSDYVDPDQIQPGPGNNISVDAVSGTVTWDSPQQSGTYNIAILITEYRVDPETGQVIEVGSVLRDMQVFINSCGNQPPVIEVPPDTCVEAGQTLNFQVTASDPDGDPVLLSAFGGPLEFDQNPAVFSQISASNPGTFSWSTICDHVRLAPYQVVFKAEDVAPSGSLAVYATVNITVVAPAPQNPTATPELGAIQLEWDQSICENAVSYKIYRRAGAYGFEPGFCETGVPEYTGYELLDTVEGLENTSYFDDNDITFGVGYCYMVVACFPDGAQSYASEEFCAEIAAEIPLITHNSVGATDTEAGIDTLRWQRPFDLDTTEIFTGPYQYNVYRGDGFNATPELIYTSPELPVLSDLPGELIVNDLNTETQANVYRVELLNDGESVSTSNPASSIFLNIDPGDEQLNLNWELNQPWVNFNYEVQQLNTSTDEWEFIANVDATNYTHTGLENGEEYCYRVIATGSYFNSVFADTLINFSQEACGFPFDNTPPCPPELEVECFCDLGFDEVTEENELFNFLSWTNPNETCEETDDTQVYYLYYAPTDTAALILVDSIFGAGNTEFEFDFNGSVAGCYAVTALDYDEINDRRNESEFSNKVCCDNCPEYELPNVFTPNGDGKNDYFRPFPYRFVESIDLVVYNRWGQPVFETDDPDILWDGTHMDSGERCSDGVYYYVCVVNTLRLSGPVTFELTGTVHLLDGKDFNNLN